MAGIGSRRGAKAGQFSDPLEQSGKAFRDGASVELEITDPRFKVAGGVAELVKRNLEALLAELSNGVKAMKEAGEAEGDTAKTTAREAAAAGWQVEDSHSSDVKTAAQQGVIGAKGQRETAALAGDVEKQLRQIEGHVLAAIDGASQILPMIVHGSSEIRRRAPGLDQAGQNMMNHAESV